MIHRARALFAFPLLAAVFVLGAPGDARSDVGVNLNINLGPPPVIESPPADLVLMPGIGVYFIPGISADIFFYDGYWWAPRGPRWYRAQSPRGPWAIARSRAVPPPLFRVPRDYRAVYGRERHVPYGQWKKEHGDHWGGRGHGRRGR
ncbi:MAG: hypothetical protein ACM3NF_10780 [Gemmatimonadota bacterium]